MKSGKSWLAIIGSILWESILFIEIGVDLYTGEQTVTELLAELTVCVLLTGIICAIIRRNIRRNRSGAKAD